MNKDEAIRFLTTDPDTGEDTGHLYVPCSRWGRNGADCAEVAWDVALIFADANGDDPNDEDLLDHLMGLVVNDHDDIASLLWAHGTAEQRDKYAEQLTDFIDDEFSDLL